MRILRIPVLSGLAMLLLGAALLTAPARAADPVPGISVRDLVRTVNSVADLPNTYTGIWDYTIVQKDCDTGAIFFTTQYTDTVCVNTDISPNPEGDYTLTCPTAEVNANSYHYVCNGSYEITPGCTASVSFEVTGTVGDGNINSVTLYNTTFSGDCFSTDPICARIEITGNRVSTATPGCNTPVETSTWGLLKSHYE